MAKETIQITQANFTVLVMELEHAINKGYTLVKEGENRPYHTIMGNFILTLEKEVDEEVCSPVVEVVEDETVASEIPEKLAQETPKPAQQRNSKPKK
jgi:hypothetical protein